MLFFGRSIAYVGDRRDKSFASLVVISKKPEGSPVRFFLYHFFPKVLPVRRFELSRIWIFKPSQEKAILLAGDSLSQIDKSSGVPFVVNGRIGWIHTVASRSVVPQPWLVINSPLDFSVPEPVRKRA